MASAYAKRLNLRLFLEGVEIPVISANVQVGPNGPVVASIQIPPLAEGTRLLPRTCVHLYFLDLYSADNPLIKVTGATGLAKNPSAAAKSRHDKTEEWFNTSNNLDATTIANDVHTDRGNEQYKVLFMGEVVGFQWAKNQSSRSLVLQCEDFSNYWDHAYQWNNTDVFGPGIKAIFSGGSTNLFDDFMSTKGNIITQIVLSGRCNSFPKLTGMAAGLIRLLEMIGGSYYPAPAAGKIARKFAGQNLFFSLAELRLHITHMVVSLENDPTSMKLLSYQGFNGMLDRILGGMGEQVSIRTCLTALAGIIFYSSCSQSCPYYIPGLEATVSGQVSNLYVTTPSGLYTGGVVTEGRDGAVTIRESIVAISQPPDKSIEQPTAADFKEYARNQASRLLAISNVLHQLIARAKSDRSPNIITSLLAQSARSLSTAGQLMSNVFSGGSDFLNPKGPKKLLAKVFKNLDSAISNLGRILEVRVSSTTEKQRDPARIATHIVKPDIWFGAPPRCNVLFPEDYNSLQYARSFLQEPTRFLLKTNDEFFGEDMLFDSWYFAPQGNNIASDQVAQLQDVLRNNLLDHELFTGILPIFEKMGEFNTHASRATTQKKPKKVGGPQRSANFLYFKHRFNARQMSVSGKFNPYLAVGFPGLVIDKYIDRESIANYNQMVEWLNKQPSRAKDQQLTPPELSEILGTNFLGNFQQVSHSVSNQGSATTEIMATYARQAEESVEFLGLEKDNVVQKSVGAAVRSTDVASINPPRVYTLGPLGGRIVNVKEVTDIYVRANKNKGDTSAQILEEAQRTEKRFLDGEIDNATLTRAQNRQKAEYAAAVKKEEETGQGRLPVFERPVSKRRGTKKAVLVPVGVPVENSQLIEILGTSDPVTFRAYRIDEEVPRFRREVNKAPMEELIRPGWYDDLWTNPKIGRAYETFLGIGSITDPQQITDPNAGSVGQLTEDQASELQKGALAEGNGDEKVDAPAALSLDEDSSIQQAVEFLVLSYSYIKQYGLDVDQFIRSYTWRPIASMVDMFGTSDLEFSETGESVVTGIEGFHSRAFGPYENIFGLAGAELDTIIGIDRSNPAHVRADTRKRKLEAVQKYISVLKTSRAILG